MIRRIFSILFLAFLFTGITYAQAGKRGVCSISVTATKMNVLYAGIENQLEIKRSVGDSLEISISKGSIERIRKSDFYKVLVTETGKVTVTVLIHNEGTRRIDFVFRVKRIPDPVPALGAKFFHSDTINAGEFKAQLGVAALLPDFDFDVNCYMIGFKVTLIGESHMENEFYTKTVTNVGARFSQETLELISEGEPGDIFIFSDILSECPGDQHPRVLNTLVFYLDDRE